MYLRCLKDSDVATPETKRMNRPFSQYELGGIVLRACPSALEEQYYLIRQSLPTKLCSLRDALKQIEKVQATKRLEIEAAKGGDQGDANK